MNVARACSPWNTEKTPMMKSPIFPRIWDSIEVVSANFKYVLSNSECTIPKTFNSEIFRINQRETKIEGNWACPINWQTKEPLFINKNQTFNLFNYFDQWNILDCSSPEFIKSKIMNIKKLTSKGSVAINGAHASSVIGFSVGRNMVLTCRSPKTKTMSVI